MEKEKKEIKINYTDVSLDFGNYENHWITKLLAKHYDVKLDKSPDFLFYSCFGIEHLKYKNCVKIFLTGENVLPDFNECDYAQGFDYIDMGNRYFHKNYIIPNRSICNRFEVDDSYVNRRFCNFIYSNAFSGEGAILRKEFCNKLMEYKHVDCPGRVLNNMSAEDLNSRSGNWMDSKLEFLKKYKFTIAFENSAANGYTTEKLLQPLQAFSIPIYWGNPLVTKDFNPKSFINVNDYDNDLDAVVERVKELDNDPDKYLAMLRENPMQPDFDFEQNKKFEDWLVNIVEKGNKPLVKDPHNYATSAYLLDELRKKEEELNNYMVSFGDIEDVFATARIDILCPLAKYQQNINIQNYNPAYWLSKFDKFGYVIQQAGVTKNIEIQVINDTKLTIFLKGPDKRDENGQLVENWVDFTSLVINGKEILPQITPVWHNKPFIHVMDVKKDDVINIHAKWKKHENVETTND